MKTNRQPIASSAILAGILAASCGASGVAEQPTAYKNCSNLAIRILKDSHKDSGRLRGRLAGFQTIGSRVSIEELKKNPLPSWTRNTKVWQDYIEHPYIVQQVDEAEYWLPGNFRGGIAQGLKPPEWPLYSPDWVSKVYSFRDSLMIMVRTPHSEAEAQNLYKASKDLEKERSSLVSAYVESASKYLDKLVPAALDALNERYSRPGRSNKTANDYQILKAYSQHLELINHDLSKKNNELWASGISNRILEYIKSSSTTSTYPTYFYKLFIYTDKNGAIKSWPSSQLAPNDPQIPFFLDQRLANIKTYDRYVLADPEKDIRLKHETADSRNCVQFFYGTGAVTSSNYDLSEDRNNYYWRIL